MAEIVRRRFHLSTEITGFVVGAFGLATMLGNALTRAIGQRVRAALVVQAGIVATAGGCLVIGVLPVHSLPLAAIAGVAWAIGYGAAGPFHHASLGAGNEQARVTVTALHASLLNLGIVVVAFAAGRFFDSVGVEIVVAMAVGGMAIALVLLLGIAR